MLRLVPLITDTIAIEADAITPDRLLGLSASAIAQIPIQRGNREQPLGELFRFDGDPADGQIEIVGDCSHIKNLGRAMTFGHLIVRGNVGMHLGAGMKDGRIDVHGNANDWLGAEMRGGLIHVHGRAGNLVGAAYRGATKGMCGGTILINGDAGDEVGAAMRRGLIVIGGRCGDMAGIAMIAGSVIACGGLGKRPGAGMKRGSIISLGSPVELPSSFRYDCEFDPVFLRLYFRQLRTWGFTALPEKPGKIFRRFSGDLLSLGKGEILFAIGGK